MEKYKVKIFDANKKVDKVIVFGIHEDEEPIFDELFEKEEIELEQITQEKLIFSPVQIHQDDSIDQVKRKIINVFDCNYAELYLFCYKTRTIKLIDALMKSTKSIITNKIFRQFLRNVDLEEDDEVREEREIYEQKYLASLGFNKEETYSIKTSLGIEFNKGVNYLFSPNPFLNDPEVMNSITTSPNEDKHLGKVDDNCIYACLAKDVFQYAKDLSEMYSRIYFPNLQAKNIFNLNDLNNKQKELEAETKSKMEEKYFNSYNIIDELYNIHNSSTTKVLDIKEGIRRFTIEVLPNNKILMPLDAIFKNISCDQMFPFIKYNPGKNRQSICRLYSTSISKTGKKIPFLSKNKIMNLIRITPTNKQISIYNSVHKMLIGIEVDGVINIMGEFKNGVKTKKEMEDIIKKSVNPLIAKINEYLANTGYDISQVESIETVKIVKMDYEFTTYLENIFFEIKKGNAIVLNGKKYSVKEKVYSVDKFIQELTTLISPDGFSVSFDSNKLTFRHKNTEFKMSTTIKDIGFGEKNIRESVNFSLEMPEKIKTFADMKLENVCIYPVFDVIKNNVKDGAILRFKRVENFKKENGMYSLIYDMLKKRDKLEDAYTALIEQYRFGENEAKLLVSRVIDSDDFTSKNPGLITTMKLDGNTLMVNVNNLNDIKYIDTLKIYLDSIIKITQDIEEPTSCNAIVEEDKNVEEIDVNKLIREARKEEAKEEEAKEEEEEEEEEVFGNEAESDYVPSNDEEMSGGYSKHDLVKRLKEKDPILFKSVKIENGEEVRYSRTCPTVRQPVVISDKEKEDIDKNYRDSYGEALHYGSTKENKNWYICPQFWCFPKNTSMTKKQIEQGECGTTPKEIKENVFEFNDKSKHIDKNGEYQRFNPGLISGKHQDENLCFPCCYKEWDSKPQRATQDKCKKHIEGEKEETPSAVAIDKKKPSQKIMEHNSKLTPGRWGYLPISIRQFMRVRPEKKEDDFLFLRYGTEQNLKQSLVGCLADIYARTQYPYSAISIEKMREKLAKSVTPELFKKYGKGSFASLVSIDAFRNYLLDEKSVIDHTYLWDIISSDNSDLFEDGLNMVIMEIVNNDITDKVDVICPLTSYSKTFFDINRKTIFLIKTGSIYEPVYFVKKSNKEGTAEPFFHIKNQISNITSLLKHLDNTMNKSCVHDYNFKFPMKISDLISYLDKIQKYNIVGQVVNYQEQTIALWVKTPSGNHIVVPCEPSESQDEYQIIHMNESKLWVDYETTFMELVNLKKANPKIMCQPIVKMYDKGIIIGFLTETNQFIKLGGDPAENMVQDVEPLEMNDGKDPYEIEMLIQNTTTGDQERISAVDNIKRESNFYALYRSTIKTLLENNRESRNEIISIIENEDLISKEKLNKIIRNIRSKNMDCKPIVSIINDVNLSYKDKLKKVVKEMNLEIEDEDKYVELSYKEKLNKVFVIIQKITEDVVIYGNGNVSRKGQLVVPKKNLVSKKENSEIYPYRVADEIVRFGKIQNYILSSNQFLNSGNVNYKINPDEFIIGETKLSDNYFEDLVNQDNEYLSPFNSINGIPYDMAKTKLYSPRVVELEENETIPELKDTEVKEYADECIKEYYFRDQTKDKPEGKGKYWGDHVFPSETEIIKFDISSTCSFGPLIYIMQQLENKTYTIPELKQMLWDAYADYIEDLENKKKIVKILSVQGKRSIINGKTDFETVLKSEEYYITTLDIWVFAQKYKVPIILFSTDNVMKDVLISQENNSNFKKKIYFDDENGASIKNSEYANSWIILGYRTGINDNFFFYESAPEYRGNIKPQKIIKQSFYSSELKDLENRLKKIFAENKILSFTEYLEKI